MTIKKIRLEDKIEEIQGRSWQPNTVTKVNDHAVRLAYFFKNYHWHKHENSDELFYVIKGRVRILLEEEELTLAAGELVVIPKGTAHCPKSERGALVLLFEPFNIKSMPIEK